MSVEFCELDEANRKVQEWKREAKQSAPVHLASGVDISLSPTDPQHVLPDLSPFQVLRTRDILTKLVRLPSITCTATVSGGFGVVLTLLLTAHRHRGGPSSRLAVVRNGFSRLIRFLLCAVASVAYLRFLRQRYPTVLPVSQYQNLSRALDGPCFVANRVLTITNSQVGTHADGPHHFCRSLSHRNYDDAHYSGDAVVLDLSAELLAPSHDAEVRAITVDMMQRACARLPAGYRDKSVSLWRLLIVTQRGPTSNSNVAADVSSLAGKSLNVLLDSDEMQQMQTPQCTGTLLPAGKKNNDNPCAFLYPETIEYLRRNFPQLLLIGIDSPSVDPTYVTPLLNHAHGALLRCGMAMLENLRFTRLRPLLETAVSGPKGVVVGSMLTVFSSTLNYDDARGCAVVFFPEEEPQ